jgi:heptosyltransferase-2
MNTPKRILVRGNNWLGDAVMSLPTIDALRGMFPEARVDVLTRPELAELYGAAAVSRADNGYDAALILPRSFRSAWEIYRARIPRRIGYASFGRTVLLTDSLLRTGDVLKIHRVRYFYRLLTLLGDAPEVRPPTLEVPEAARAWAAEQMPGERWVCVNAGATYGTAKQWLPDRFAALSRRLIEEAGYRVALVGQERIDGIPATRDFFGRTGLMQLAAVLQRAALLVTNDTGPMHVADAVGTRVVAIFGPTDPATTAPFRPQRIVRRPIECAPCLERTCPLGHHRCMTEISVDDVFAACVA